MRCNCHSWCSLNHVEHSGWNKSYLLLSLTIYYVKSAQNFRLLEANYLSRVGFVQLTVDTVKTTDTTRNGKM